jgi:hypothetical protein
MKTIGLLIAGIIIGMVFVRNFKKIVRDIYGALYVLFMVTIIRLYHLITKRERLSTYYKREEQKNIDDAYEKLGWPRGTFNQWQLIEAKRGSESKIAKFSGPLNGYTALFGEMITDYGILPPIGQTVHVVCWNKPMKGVYYGHMIGWVAGNDPATREMSDPVTHWRVSHEDLPLAERNRIEEALGD